jgi:hypothetical protein
MNYFNGIVVVDETIENLEPILADDQTAHA